MSVSIVHSTDRAGFVTSFRVIERTLVIDLHRPRRILSSAPRGGGLVTARYVLNHQVDIRPEVRDDGWGDPRRYLGRLAHRLRAGQRCVALMTAVPMTQLVCIREQADGVWMEAFLTVGLTNAVRVGESPVARERRLRGTPGTINVILVTNARLALSAMVTLVQVATEGKTAALLAAGVKSCSGADGATGTGTDALVVVNGAGPRVRYGGTHTLIGALVGRVISRGMDEGIRRYRKWAATGCSKGRVAPRPEGGSR
ncbi:adenosylcobinamide amidohydrolase [Candidatus Nitrospira bockiana]